MVVPQCKRYPHQIDLSYFYGTTLHPEKKAQHTKYALKRFIISKPGLRDCELIDLDLIAEKFTGATSLFEFESLIDDLYKWGEWNRVAIKTAS